MRKSLIVPEMQPASIAKQMESSKSLTRSLRRGALGTNQCTVGSCAAQGKTENEAGGMAGYIELRLLSNQSGPLLAFSLRSNFSSSLARLGLPKPLKSFCAQTSFLTALRDFLPSIAAIIVAGIVIVDLPTWLDHEQEKSNASPGYHCKHDKKCFHDVYSR